MRRVFVAASGVGAVLVAIYRAPIWLEAWNAGAVVAAFGAAAAFLVLTVGIAVHGSAGAVRRVAMEMSLCAAALLLADAILLVRAPENWSDDPLVQRMILRQRAALEQGLRYDRRLRADVVRDLRSRGLDAVPGVAQIGASSPAITAAIRERGLLPLSNISNAFVVECNEGTGYLQYRTDELGFNNPSGVIRGPVDVAVIGESFALGHCVSPEASAVEIVRSRFPRTANFGVAGSRVLSQLGVFREYVEPLEPPVIVWFVNTSFAEAREERDQPVLVSYLTDDDFSQRLRKRQGEVDAFVRELLIPLNLRRDELLRAELDDASRFPLESLLKLREVRRATDFSQAARRPFEPPDLADFGRALDRMATTAGHWQGSVIVVILPSYAISMRRAENIARYEAVLNAVESAGVVVVDGVALFAADPDTSGLYTLGIDNHPSERGHAVIGEAVVAAIGARAKR